MDRVRTEDPEPTFLGQDIGPLLPGFAPDAVVAGRQKALEPGERSGGRPVLSEAAPRLQCLEGAGIHLDVWPHRPAPLARKADDRADGRVDGEEKKEGQVPARMVHSRQPER